MSTPPEDDSSNTVTISFSVGGWLQMYHFGACQAFLESGFIDRLKAEGKQVRFSGSSAGSLAAAAIASESYFFEEMRDYAVECGEHFRSSVWHMFMMSTYLDSCVKRFGTRRLPMDQPLEDEFAWRKEQAHKPPHKQHKRRKHVHSQHHHHNHVSTPCDGGEREQHAHARTKEEEEAVLRLISDGRLEVYMTTLPFLTKKCVSSFKSMDEVEEALRASCCMSPLVGLPFPLEATGEWVIDGGIRAFQPRNGEANTLTIAPFYFSSSAHIKPSMFMPAWWGIRPPPKEQHLAIFTTGYNDTIEYLIRHQLIDKDEGVDLLREEPEEVERSYWGIAQDILTAIIYVVFFRFFALIMVYMELWAMVIFTLFKSFFFGAWSDLYHMIRNIISLRVMLNLLVSAHIPINTERLHKHSFVYRFFAPIVFSTEGMRSKWRTSHNARKHFRAKAHAAKDHYHHHKRRDHLEHYSSVESGTPDLEGNPGPLFSPLKKSSVAT